MVINKDQDECLDFIMMMSMNSAGEFLVNKKINLCDMCNKEFSNCKSIHEFGDGLGNDNIYKCNSFEKRVSDEK